MASVLGLATYMHLTTEVSLAQHFEVIKLFTLLGKRAAVVGWNEREKWELSGRQVSNIGKLVGEICSTEWKRVGLPDGPEEDESRYDAILFVDASAEGWGAVTRNKSGETVELREGWSSMNPFSARAEPEACRRALHWIKRMWGARTIAVATDHQPIVLKQKRNQNGTGGFSGSFFLNRLFAEHPEGIQYFHVPGERNVADRPSRMTRVGMPLHEYTVKTELPSFADCQCTHPFVKWRALEEWQC